MNQTQKRNTYIVNLGGPPSQSRRQFYTAQSSPMPPAMSRVSRGTDTSQTLSCTPLLHSLTSSRLGSLPSLDLSKSPLNIYPAEDIVSRYSMLLGGLGYTAYAAQMLYLSDYLLYTCALLNGLGASLLWTGQGYGTQSFMSAPHLPIYSQNHCI